MSAEGRRRLRDNQEGAAVLEFALIAPVLCVLLIGAIQLAWALHCAASVRWSLESSARHLIIEPDTTATQLRAAMLSQLTGLADTSNLSVTLIEDASNPTTVVARASSLYERQLSIAFLPTFDLQFRAETVVPLPPA